ncbi:coproporphyrinogen III oxidase family protein [Candidatus Gracilibacteria bacterium]|nr:coproporphyrinogen III oxidase family protein [Candidatus Gracilibacteria bacterium]
MTNHFYIHIPFCNQKCPYCKFALTPIFDEFKKRRYLEYLKKEIRTYFLNYTHNNLDKTIYFGGGTPSILSHEEIREILESFPFYKNNQTEITLESNPEDISEKYVEGLIELGINRLSMGIQTLNDQSLTEIHRSDKHSIIQALEDLQKAISKKGNISVNIDFIVGLPYTQKGEILQAIQEIHKKYSYITHTSVYMLEDEDYPKHWKENSISEIDIQDEFTQILEYFEQVEWNHYELSNFAKPGFESIHNRGYWNHSNSRGFGLSSASFENNIRWNNASSFTGYYEGKKEHEEILNPKSIEIEKMMFGLRTHGWQVDDNFLKDSSTKVSILQEQNLIILENNTIQLTKTGIFLIDYVLSELL